MANSIARAYSDSLASILGLQVMPMQQIGQNHQKAYLGTGWASPLRVNLQGSIQLSSAERNIEESIWIVLRTSLGERVYRPNFGSRLSELVFAPMTTQTLLMMRLYVQEALEMWEPRIVIDEVRTDPDPVRGRVDIIIDYHPKDSHDARSLVYPFYLLPGGLLPGGESGGL